jgi:hypothetical protein
LRAYLKFVTNLLGGVEMAGRIHRFAAVVLFVFFFYHIYSLIKLKLEKKTPLKEFLFGRDSMLPNAQDLKDFVGTMKWFFRDSPPYGHGPTGKNLIIWRSSGAFRSSDCPVGRSFPEISSLIFRAG